MMPVPTTPRGQDSQEVTNAILAQKLDYLTDFMRGHVTTSEKQYEDHEARIRKLEESQTERKIKVEGIVCDIEDLKKSKASASEIKDLRDQVHNWNLANSVAAGVGIMAAAVLAIFKK